MFFARYCVTTLMVLVMGPLAAVPADASAGEPTALYKAYFLEHQSQDYTAARALYQEILSSKPSDTARQLAQAGADRCRDHLAAEDFALLMPADSLMYVEITRPGQLIEELMSMLGLAGQNMQDVLANRPDAESNLPFHIPERVVISPEIFEALGSFGGMAMAVTHFDPECDGPPTGVMVVHHGDVKLLKGILETAFQFAPTTKKIHDLPTFGAVVPEVGQVSGVLTESLLIVGTSRDLVEGVVGRLVGDTKDSLGAREDLAEVSKTRAGSTLFAYVDLQAVLKLAKSDMSERDLREFKMANAIADLDSLRWATFSAGARDGQLGIELAVRLADDHHSIAYNMMRLPPMQRRSLEHVPPNAAAIFGIGLNPVLTSAVIDNARQPDGQIAVTGFDIGREFFGNIQEFSVFVVPGKMRKPSGRSGPPVVPNIGIVMAVNDVAKSRALWNQFLAIPGLVGGDEPVPPTEMKIGDTPVTAYMIQDLGKVYMTQLDGCVAIGTSRTAMKAMIHADTPDRSVLKDPVMGRIIDGMPTDSSIMLVAHVGRLVDVAAGSGDPMVSMWSSQAGEFCSDLVVWAGLGQSPAQMTLRVAVAGLPNLNKALAKYRPMINGIAGAAMSGRNAHVEFDGDIEVDIDNGDRDADDGDYDADVDDEQESDLL